MLRASGKFVLRLTPELHGQLKRRAQQRGVSLNTLCAGFIEFGLSHSRQNLPLKRLQRICDKVKKTLPHVMGILVFGSIVTKLQFESSDIDLLVIMDQKATLNRGLYHLWDSNIDDVKSPPINPHFTHLPDLKKRCSSLWLEVAQTHEVLWQKNQKLQKVIDQIKRWIAMGMVEPKTSHGQRYWVWKQQNA